MTDFRFESDEFEDPETVSEFSMDDYEKYRLKTSGLTIDLAIVDLDGRDKDEYIQGRREDLNDSKTDVPHPYKPEKQEEEKRDDLVEFESKPLHGKGLANPEYNLVTDSGNELVRYVYFVTWKHISSQNKLMEIEIYAPQNLDVKIEKLLKLSESIECIK